MAKKKKKPKKKKGGKPYDSSLNQIIEMNPNEWGQFLIQKFGFVGGNVTLEESNLSRTLQADKLFSVHGTDPRLLHTEFDVSPHKDLPDRVLAYNVNARVAFQLPVSSIIILLSPKGDHSILTGVLEVKEGDTVTLLFRYKVLRVWEETIDSLLAFGPTLAPLALLTDEAAKAPESYAQEIYQRLQKDEATSKIAEELLTPMTFLAGLRYGKELSRKIFMSLANILKESHTYQLATADAKSEGKVEGKVEQAVETIFELGIDRLGPPPKFIEEQIRGINDLGVLKKLTLQIGKVDSWEALFPA